MTINPFQDTLLDLVDQSHPGSGKVVFAARLITWKIRHHDLNDAAQVARQHYFTELLARHRLQELSSLLKYLDICGCYGVCNKKWFWRFLLRIGRLAKSTHSMRHVHVSPSDYEYILALGCVLMRGAGKTKKIKTLLREIDIDKRAEVRILQVCKWAKD